MGEHVYTGGALSSCASANNPCRQAYIGTRNMLLPLNVRKYSHLIRRNTKLVGCKSVALLDWVGYGNDRNSWDPLTLVAAVRGAAGMR